ncbi:hypothetical protein CIB84_011440 [Bambusicola thoracicus]|uniref:Type I cytokine receptor cytokine-binding domain-containing protein n=1 Tax=Bambusicola thoracicus TaxID=9083 RepID=A0A2P4SL35_BAMTH|nr:hypothetical protein CIB84_011440 [Bambusicola thoracicus]
MFAGMNVTAIENFVCVIYNVSFMNCTWHVDRNASGDSQYFLYWKTSRKEDYVRCQNYIEDNCGRHTGCRFQNVTIEGSRKGYFMVNESRNGQNILPYTAIIYLYKIEKLTPPLNVTVNCTGVSHSCEIQWQRPLTSHVDRDICFKYEIVIENKVRRMDYNSLHYFTCLHFSLRYHTTNALFSLSLLELPFWFSM